jgi:hypothetical protein
MIIKEMFHIPKKLKSELAHASILGYESIDRTTFSMKSAVRFMLKM